MAKGHEDNEQRLRDADVIITSDDLEEPYQAVVEGLTPEEVDVLIAVRRRLAEADRVFGWDQREDKQPPHSVRMPP